MNGLGHMSEKEVLGLLAEELSSIVWVPGDSYCSGEKSCFKKEMKTVYAPI